MNQQWPDSHTFWPDKRAMTGGRGRRSTQIDLMAAALLQVRRRTMIA